MGLFQEYLDSRGKVRKPVVDVSGDQIDPKTSPNAPPKGGKPYVANGSKKGKKGCNKGFADMGDNDLKYMPSTTGKGKAPAKIPTVEQVELATIVIEALKRDNSFAERLVYEAKTNGVLGLIIAEALEHRVTYNHLVEVMAHKTHGPTMCDKLVRAMNGVVTEEVSPPESKNFVNDESDFEDNEFADDELDDEFGNEEGLDDEMPPEEGEKMPCPECNGEDPNCETCLGTGEVDAEMGMDDMGMDMGVNQDPSMPPPVGGQMPPAANPLMNGNPAMQNFQRAMMRRW